MNRTHLLLTALLLSPLAVSAQGTAPAAGPAAAPAKRTDVYHVHFTGAAPGKAAALGEFLKTSAPAGHSVVLRHQDGAEWDYVVIEHLGPKTTVEAAGNPPPAAARDLSAWHGDTFVNGPAWADFAKAMGLDDAAKSAASPYVVSTYRALPAHRDALEKMLGTPDPNDTAAGSVLMAHLEGGPWTFLSIARYNSWAEFAAGEVSSIASQATGTGGWFDLREHAATHNDTLASRVAP